jgi:hypothetical protein
MISLATPTGKLVRYLATHWPQLLAESLTTLLTFLLFYLVWMRYTRPTPRIVEIEESTIDGDYEYHVLVKNRGEEAAEDSKATLFLAGENTDAGTYHVIYQRLGWIPNGYGAWFLSEEVEDVTAVPGRTTRRLRLGSADDAESTFAVEKWPGEESVHLVYRADAVEGIRRQITDDESFVSLDLPGFEGAIERQEDEMEVSYDDLAAVEWDTAVVEMLSTNSSTVRRRLEIDADGDDRPTVELRARRRDRLRRELNRLQVALGR